MVTAVDGLMRNSFKGEELSRTDTRMNFVELEWASVSVRKEMFVVNIRQKILMVTVTCLKYQEAQVINGLLNLLVTKTFGLIGLLQHGRLPLRTITKENYFTLIRLNVLRKNKIQTGRQMKMFMNAQIIQDQNHAKRIQTVSGVRSK